MKVFLREFLRPWKLGTLTMGTMPLVMGSFVVQAPDWDIGISIIMAFLAYLTAPLFVQALYKRKFNVASALLPLAWLSVDGFYTLYWSIVNPFALVMRDANFMVSMPLYLIMGIFWSYNGSLKDFIRDFRLAIFR